MKHLNEALLARPDTHLSGDGVVDAAEYALEMIRFPYRQVFGDTSQPVGQLDEVFKPTVMITAEIGEGAKSLVERFEGGLA
jgi:hypothetical protein